MNFRTTTLGCFFGGRFCRTKGRSPWGKVGARFPAQTFLDPMPFEFIQIPANGQGSAKEDLNRFDRVRGCPWLGSPAPACSGVRPRTPVGGATRQAANLGCRTA